jgi:alginate O-acetyltransferase complex protein AlgJ
VRLGYDEWLFSVEEIEYFRQASEFQQVRTGVIGQLSSALARQNVRLVVAVVPDKARIHAQQFMGHRYPEWYQDRYASILQQLKAHQVMVVDVQQAMRLELAARPDQSLYYRTDTHWNQTGARLAAQAVSQVVRQQGLKGESVVFQTETDDKTTVRVGDLLRMMGLGDMPDLFRPNPDTEHTDTTRKLAGNASMGLLGDIQVPVTLVGTSYSLRANFQGYLQASLQADVLNVAQDGGGFMQSMASYLKDDAFKSSPPQVLVWEIPERVFSRPLAVNESQPPGF